MQMDWRELSVETQVQVLITKCRKCSVTWQPGRSGWASLGRFMVDEISKSVQGGQWAWRKALPKLATKNVRLLSDVLVCQNPFHPTQYIILRNQIGWVVLRDHCPHLEMIDYQHGIIVLVTHKGPCQEWDPTHNCLYNRVQTTTRYKSTCWWMT